MKRSLVSMRYPYNCDGNSFAFCEMIERITSGWRACSDSEPNLQHFDKKITDGATWRNDTIR